MNKAPFIQALPTLGTTVPRAYKKESPPREIKMAGNTYICSIVETDITYNLFFK